MITTLPVVDIPRMNNDPTHLIIRFLSNEATPDEHEMLFDWINEDPKHHKMFEAYYFLWHKKSEGPTPPHLQKRLQQLNSRIDAMEAEAEKSEFFSWESPEVRKSGSKCGVVFRDLNTIADCSGIVDCKKIRKLIF